MKFKCFTLVGTMAFFGNLNLAPFTVTPAQSSDGKFFMFFGTIPQEVVFCGPAPMASFTPAAIQISTLDEEEAEFALTQKGINNNTMNSPTSSPRRRRRPARKMAPTTETKVAHNSQVSRKRALDEYQNQLVARPAISVSNPFSALCIVAKNSITGQLRQAWEVPQPAPRSTHARNAPRS
jgi:hypothetical protein